MRSFSDHCAHLGCPLSNVRSAWCAISPDGKRAVFTLWADEIKDRQFLLHPTEGRRSRAVPDLADERPGSSEVKRIASIVAVNKDVEALGVLCFAEDPKAQTRTRRDFDDKTVFRLRVERVGERLVAHLIGTHPCR